MTEDRRGCHSRVLAAGLWLALSLCLPLTAREKAPAEPPPVAVAEHPELIAPGAQFSVPAADATITHRIYRLGTATVRLDFRHGILHLTVLSGLLRLELQSGHELVILSTGDDIEISGLVAAPPAAAAGAGSDASATAAAGTADAGSAGGASGAGGRAPEPTVLIDLYHRTGDDADAANHILRLRLAVPMKLRNNGGYPVAVNARGKLLRLDEGGSGISLDAEGRHLQPADVQERRRRRSNPAGGGASQRALFKP